VQHADGLAEHAGPGVPQVRGKLTGRGPWTLIPADASVVARIVIRDLVRGEQPATDEFLIWRDYRATPEGQPYDSAAAARKAAALPPTA
jgi:hypothetical protein